MQYLEQHILLLESDQLTRTLYNRELSRYYTVFACDDVINALVILRAEQIHLIVLEPVSLVYQGWEFLAAVRAERMWQHIPVLLCSLRDERRRGLELGISVCLVKPVLPTLLLATIHELFSPQHHPRSDMH